MLWDPRVPAFVGELHTALRCGPKLLMDTPGRMLDMLQKGASKVFWSLVGLISNTKSSKKMSHAGKTAEFTTCSQCYGRKYNKFLEGFDMRTKALIAPCAASALDPPYAEAQAARCLQHQFQWLVYKHPMSAELFGKPKAEVHAKLLRVVDSWVRTNGDVFPANRKRWTTKDGVEKESWFSWMMRSCAHYATELPLRLLARGFPDPWESQTEEAQVRAFPAPALRKSVRTVRLRGVGAGAGRRSRLLRAVPRHDRGSQADAHPVRGHVPRTAEEQRHVD
jgi:hypothetical protein